MRRLSYYILSGIVAALFGWSLSQIFLIDLANLFKQLPFLKDSLNYFHDDIVLFPIVAACLAGAMVIADIFMSNPTRYKANRRELPPYLWRAIGIGLGAGLLSALISWILYASNLPKELVRVVAWCLIGFFTGLGESIVWRFRSEEGETSKANRRMIRVILCGLIAGFVAAVLIEIIRRPIELKGWEDPLGFFILGLSLGAFLSFGTSPSYQAALRAGQGFEFYFDKSGIQQDNNEEQQNQSKEQEKKTKQQQDKNEKHLPKLQNPLLRFVTEDTEDDEEKVIEEGLSIQLPTTLEKPIFIGSDPQADIYIPNIPSKCASLTQKNRMFILKCLTEDSVRVNQDLKIKNESVTLRHNQIITLYYETDNSMFYRFVFYNRFLDPEA